IFFPLIIIFWEIPKTFFLRKSWIFLFTYLYSILNHIIRLKITLIKVVLWGIVILILFNLHTDAMFYICISILLLLLSWHFFIRFKLIFSPFNIFGVDLSEAIHKLREEKKGLFKNYIEAKESPSTTNTNTIKFTKLEKIVVASKVMDLANNKLRKFHNGRLYILFLLIKIMFTLFVTIIIFSLINFSLFKISPANFKLTGLVNFCTCFYNSFNASFFNSI